MRTVRDAAVATHRQRRRARLYSPPHPTTLVEFHTRRHNRALVRTAKRLTNRRGDSVGPRRVGNFPCVVLAVGPTGPGPYRERRVPYSPSRQLERVEHPRRTRICNMREKILNALIFENMFSLVKLVYDSSRLFMFLSIFIKRIARD